MSRHTLALAAVLAALTAQAGAPPGEEPPDARAVARAHEAFACDLYRRLATGDGDLFLSPASIALALSMTLAGARAGTAEEMRTVLHYPESGPAVHRAAGELQRALLEVVTQRRNPDEPAFKLNLANRLWGQVGLPFGADFLEICQRDYGAELGPVDFAGAPDPARQEINTWVGDQTAGKITDLVPPGAVTSRTRLMLTNAVHFLAQWVHPFAKDRTTDLPFNLAGGATVSVPTMRQSENFGYADSDQLQVVQLPYGGGRQVCEVYLPRDRDGLAAIETKLSPAWFERWRAQIRSRQVNLSLPRFRIVTRFDLGETLAALGMPSAFSSAKADFSGMTESTHLFIDRVLHKAVVDLDEAGTEAAAATAVGMSLTSISPGTPVVFNADHPFLFLIRDIETGAVLFLGRVTDPRD